MKVWECHLSPPCHLHHTVNQKKKKNKKTSLSLSISLSLSLSASILNSVLELCISVQWQCPRISRTTIAYAEPLLQSGTSTSLCFSPHSRQPMHRFLQLSFLDVIVIHDPYNFTFLIFWRLNWILSQSHRCYNPVQQPQIVGWVFIVEIALL